MIEITNRNKFQVPLMVRSKTAPKAFTVLNVPGIGAGRNVVTITDEMYTDQIARVERDMKLVTTRTVPNKTSKGE